MSFGEAIELLKQGALVQRAGWNGKGMYLYLQDPFVYAQERKYEPCICMFTAQQKHQPGWLASQADMLADDWGIGGRCPS